MWTAGTGKGIMTRQRAQSDFISLAEQTGRTQYGLPP